MPGLSLSAGRHPPKRVSVPVAARALAPWVGLRHPVAATDCDNMQQRPGMSQDLPQRRCKFARLPRETRSDSRICLPVPKPPLTIARRHLLQLAAAGSGSLLLPRLALAQGTDPAAEVHAIAMHGAPKYPAGFARFDYTAATAQPGGTLVQSATGSFDSLNPWIVRGVVPEQLDLCFARLGQRGWDEPFTLYGALAEGFTLPPQRDGMDIRLRSTARFEDGTPLTAEDVLWSWQMLRDRGRPNHRRYYSMVSSAEALDPQRLRFRFKPLEDGSIDRELPLILCLMPILPRHWFAERDFDATTLQPPPGTGPYRVAEVDPGRSIVYTRVKDWWGDALPGFQGLYNAQTLRIDYYRSENVALQAFNSGRVSLRREPDVRRWQSEYGSAAVSSGRMKLGEYPHNRPDPARFFVFNTRRPIFADRRVRLALLHAFDGAWVNRTLYGGGLKRIDSFFPNSELAAHGLPSGAERALLEALRAELPAEIFDTAPPLPDTDGSGPAGLRRNLRQAEALLAEAGWTLKDGRRLQADGSPAAFTILLQDADEEKIALELSRSLNRLGITAKVQTVDSAQYRARQNGFDYDMMSWAWINSLSPGNEQQFYWSSSAADNQGSRNYAGVRDRAVDRLTAMLGAAVAREDLVAAVRALDRVLLWGCYGVPLFYAGVDRVASWDRVHQPPQESRYGAVLESWWVDPAT